MLLFKYNAGINVKIDHTLFCLLSFSFGTIEEPITKHSHGNNSYEIHYITHGKGWLTTNEKTYELTPNTLFVTGPHIEHEQISDKEDPMSEYCLYFNLQTLSDSSDSDSKVVISGFKDTVFWFGEDSQDIYPLLQRITYELENQKTGYMLTVKSYIEQYIVKMVRNYEIKSKKSSLFHSIDRSYNKYFIVDTVIQAEYNTITLNDLSERIGLSPRQTERFIKEYFGTTFLQKRNETKMEVAKQLLANKKLSIYEISERLNFSSPQHFSDAFKKFTGISASEYRKRL